MKDVLGMKGIFQKNLGLMIEMPKTLFSLQPEKIHLEKLFSAILDTDKWKEYVALGTQTPNK